ncbi:MAG TPA: hypothetical protein ENG13_06025 [bacterium]|nr:hypothetical protein [bacterium]HEX68601.1 hypothetical protein [bacterium]
MRIKISFPGKGVMIRGALNDTRTAQKIWEALPQRTKGERWGDEFYFPLPISAEPENQKSAVEKGDIGYWIPGKALCLFFGPTPISKEGKIIPASPVNVVGRMEGDFDSLKILEDGDEVIVEKDEEN